VRTKAARTIFATWIFASLLVACGGGGPPAECPPNVHPAFCVARPGDGGGGDVNNPAAAAGLWEGSTSNGRRTLGAVLSNGSYWFFYSAVADPTRLAGVGEGTATSIGSTLTSTNGRDFNLEGLGVNPASLTASYVPQTSLSGTIRYPNQTVSFDASYLTFPAAALSDIAGSYRGDAAVVGASQIESVSFSIGATGLIRGTTTSGCNFTGTATPRTDVAVFDMTVAFSGGACALGVGTVRGIGIYNTDTRQLLGAGVTGDRTNALLALGTKQ
jgi:hypothetical protein